MLGQPKMLDQDSAKGWTDREPKAVAGGPHTQCPRSLGTVGPDDPNDRQRCGNEKRSARACDRPACDENTDKRGDCADKRGGTEDPRAGYENEASALEVGQQTAGEQQYGINQVVAVDDPLQVAHAGAEIVSDRVDREIHNCGIDLGNQNGQAQRHQSERMAPAASTRRARH